eukprot:15270498-Heterocapsa_arctica.AAC.1
MGVGHHWDSYQIYAKPALLDHVRHHWGNHSKKSARSNFCHCDAKLLARPGPFPHGKCHWGM